MKNTNRTKSITCSIISKGIIMQVNNIDEILSPGHYKIDACGVTASDGFPDGVDGSCLSAYLEVSDTNHSADNLKNAAVGQTLTYTDADGCTAVYHRSVTHKNGIMQWNGWDSFGSTTSVGIQDGAITMQKLANDVRENVGKVPALDSYIQESVNDINDRLGFYEESITLSSADLLPMVWNGSKMTSSTDYNCWIVPLTCRREYNLPNNSFVQSKRVCTDYPVLGNDITMETVTSNPFIASAEAGYLVIAVTVSKYDGSDYVISVKGSGLMTDFKNIGNQLDQLEETTASTLDKYHRQSKELYYSIGSKNRTVVLTSDDYDNLIWNGTKFLSGNASYNGFVIPLYPGETIRYTAPLANNLRTLQEYPTVGSSDFVRSKTELGNEFTVQDNEHFLYLNADVAKFTSYEVIAGVGDIDNRLETLETKLQFPLYGKTIVCFGDSITEFNDSNNKGYADYLSDLTGAKIVRAGVGGTQLATRKEVQEIPTDYSEAYAAVDISNLVKAWTANDWVAVDNAVAWLAENKSDDNSAQVDRLKATPVEDTDIVIIFGGTNDLANSTFGAPVDSSPVGNTCGGINQIVDSILSVKPKMAIYFFTPLPRMVNDVWCDDYRAEQTDSVGSLSFPSLVKRIKECVEHNHIPCCNMYDSVGINRKNIYVYASDGVHPRNAYPMIANRIFGFMMANRTWS
ncbi:MAG: SGNH/GDSL hydrolase family protein [Bacteroidaceae bacterium]|nr:SGNH/GDSL hydrolase family protein [Bacteroidaceae bacterium]